MITFLYTGTSRFVWEQQGKHQQQEQSPGHAAGQAVPRHRGRVQQKPASHCDSAGRPREQDSSSLQHPVCGEHLRTC